MKFRDYIISERFIHDGIAQQASAAVAKLPELWRRQKKIAPTLFLWPGEAAATDDGSDPVTGLTVCVLPPEPAAHGEVLRRAIERVKAYAFLFIHQDNEAVKALLESPHGTRAWTMALKRSADTWVLGKVEVRDNKDSMGLLWSPSQGSS